MDGLYRSNGKKDMREGREAGCLLRLREVLRGEDRSGTVPLALEHFGEVSSGNDVLGEMIEESVRNRLVNKLAESLLPLSTVLELGKEQRSSASE